LAFVYGINIYIHQWFTYIRMVIIEELRAIRVRTGLSQDKFAALIGVKPFALRNWEQGHTQPTGQAKALLRILEADTENAVRTPHPRKKRAAG
jgi:DNA-binding transcriptional regulator YiaG